MAEDFRPRWVGPVSVLFSLALLGGVLSLVGLIVSAAFETSGPSAETTFFADTLPRWWIARSRGEPPPVDLFDELPKASLQPVFEQLDGLFSEEPKALAVESAALNQALEDAELPFWVDVVVRGSTPVILSYAIEARDRWSIGEAETDVLWVSRLDRSNAVSAYTGKRGYDLPVVLVAELERGILELLRAPPGHPVVDARKAWLSTWLQSHRSSLEAVQASVLERDRRILRMERRMKSGRLRVTRPERFELPYAWYAWLRRYSEGGYEGIYFFSKDIDAVEAADVVLSTGEVGTALRSYRDVWARIGSAHQAHATLALEADEEVAGPVPPELVAYYGPDDTPFRQDGHLHMRAALGAARDADAPMCASLLRLLSGAAGPHARATAWHYGTMSALHAWFETTETAPGALAQAVIKACEQPDEVLRARARRLAARLGVPPAEPSGSATRPDSNRGGHAK